MRRLVLLTLAVFFAISCSKDDSDYEYLQLENQVFELVNQHRQEKGLQALKPNSLIVEQARSHSIRMASGAVEFGHDGFTDRFNAIKEKLNATSGGENVAYGYTTPQAVVTGWLNSSGHKANIEGNYTLSGIGIAKSKEGNYYYTQIFIKN